MDDSGGLGYVLLGILVLYILYKLVVVLLPLILLLIGAVWVSFYVIDWAMSIRWRRVR